LIEAGRGSREVVRLINESRRCPKSVSPRRPREDLAVVEQIIGILRNSLSAIGLQVWFDREIPIASEWEKVLQQRFGDAKA